MSHKAGSIGWSATLVVALLAPVLIASCRDASPSAPLPVTLALPDSAVLRVGDRRLLGGTELQGSDVVWASSDPAVVGVSVDGTVVGLSPGDAVITATLGSDAGTRDSVMVTVLPVLMTLIPAAVTLLSGRTVVVHALVAGAADGTVLWRSDAPGVASVAGNGVVTGRSTGTATITAVLRADTLIRRSVQAEVNVQLRVAAAIITQVTQTPAGDVPLVAGRPGLLRVFVTSNLPNGLTPPARVRLYRDGAQLATYSVKPAAASVPLAGEDDSLAAPWSVLLPGSLIQPGLSLLVDVDPNGDVAQPDRAQDVYPAGGVPRPLDVRVAAPMHVRLVPVLLAGATEAGRVDASNASDFLRDARRMFPADSFDADVHAVYSSSAAATTTQDAWSQIIGEIQALQVAEGSHRLYYGVLRDEPGRAWCGLGFVGAPAAIGVDACGPLVAAHEWGHNFGRFHAPCGNPANPDARYPYPGASIGAWGYDATSGARFRPGPYVDVMSYCDPEWISDYTYRGILDFRAATAASGEGAAAAAPQPSLLVWGRITAGGSVVLEPAFEVDAPPALPDRSGPYTLTGSDASGQPLFRVAFDAVPLGDGPPTARSFAFAVPRGWAPGTLRTLRLARPGGATTTVDASAVGVAAAGASVSASARLRPSGRRHRLQWDASVYRMALVRDPATGAVLAFARGGAATLDGDATTVDVTFSDGVRSLRRSVSLTP